MVGVQSKLRLLFEDEKKGPNSVTHRVSSVFDLVRGDQTFEGMIETLVAKPRRIKEKTRDNLVERAVGRIG